jgi:adenine phosphoribosyltransferase
MNSPIACNVSTDIKALKELIISVPDFPKKGILFRDITPLLRTHFNETLDQMSSLIEAYNWENIDLIAGIESRGFILAAGLAAKMNKGLIIIRKSGKLPGNVLRMDYNLEYGKDALEMAKGSGRIVMVDDVLATGGTLTAASKLAENANYHIQDILVLINLKNLNSFEWKTIPPKSVIDYE